MATRIGFKIKNWVADKILKDSDTLKELREWTERRIMESRIEVRSDTRTDIVNAKAMAKEEILKIMEEKQLHDRKQVAIAVAKLAVDIDKLKKKLEEQPEPVSAAPPKPKINMRRL